MANTERVKRKHESMDASPGRHEKRTKHKHKSTYDGDQGLRKVEEVSEQTVTTEQVTKKHNRMHESTDTDSMEQMKKKRKYKDNKSNSDQDNEIRTVTSQDEGLDLHEKKKKRKDKSILHQHDEEHPTFQDENLEQPRKKKHKNTGLSDSVESSHLENSGESMSSETPRKKKKYGQSSPSGENENVSMTKYSDETMKGKETGAQVATEMDDTEEVKPKKKKIHLSKKNYIKKKNNMKKQKKRLAAGKDVDKAGEEKQSAKDSALEYLHQWDQDRTAWKFTKVRQVWLLQHMYEEEQVDEADFETLLKYLEPLKGKARETTVKEAETVLQSTKTTDDGEVTKADRARRIIQLYPE